MARTLYYVRDERTNWTVEDAERAERLSRAGLRVTAEVRGGAVIHD